MEFLYKYFAWQNLLRGAARRRGHGALHQEADGGRRRRLPLHRRVRLQPAARGQGGHLRLQ